MERKQNNMEIARKRTLDCLREKQESFNSYPINESDLLIVEKCAICNSNNISLLTEVYLESKLNFFSTSVCNNCLYTFRSISPSFEWFKKCWQYIATDELEVFNPEVEKIRERRYIEYYELLSKHIDSGKVLDVGAAYGTGSKVFKDRGFEVEAIEPEVNKFNYIEKALNIPVKGISFEDFIRGGSEEKYDLIIFSHCLEHLDDPAFVMSHIKNLVKDILYLEVPILWEEVTWTDALFLTHKSNFTEENVFDLINKSGFKVLEKTYFRHSDEEPWDLGLVLEPIREKPKYNYSVPDNKHSVDDIRRLYRKNLPLNRVPALNQVIKYSVPYIEHFFQTVKLDAMRIVEPKTNSDYICFEAEH